MTDYLKHCADTVSALCIGLAIMDWIPKLSGLAGGIWYGIQIYSWWKVQRGIKRAKQDQRVSADVRPPTGQ